MAAKKKTAPRTPAAEDETKRKFREALEAKQGRQADGEDHTNLAPGDSHAHGPVDAKRTFRRKTG